jgi:HPt (histidine-containing phosphotransfer) domain-containing protein
MRRRFQFLGSGGTASGENVASVQDNEFDPAIIDGLRELQQPGDPDLVQGLVATFLNFLEEKIPSLQDAHHQDERAELRELAHALKGAAASVGARGVARICEGLEGGNQGGPPDPSVRDPLMTRLEGAVADTREMLLAAAASSR